MIFGYDTIGGTTVDVDRITHYYTEEMPASFLRSIVTYCRAVSGSHDIETALYRSTDAGNIFYASADSTDTITETPSWYENTWAVPQFIEPDGYFMGTVGNGSTRFYYDVNNAHVNYNAFSGAAAWATRWPDPLDFSGGVNNLDVSMYTSVEVNAINGNEGVVNNSIQTRVITDAVIKQE